MKILRRTLRKTQQITRPKWPTPRYDMNMQPHFFFLITPPYSGSTAIAKLLDTSQRTMLLSPNGEGQWLVPGLCEQDRWDPAKKVNYESVKAVWLSTFQKHNKLHPHVDVVIEKSPPNMIRIKELSSQFIKCSFLANNRDPYANCASIFSRHSDPEALKPTERKKVLMKIAQSWLMRSHKLKGIITENGVSLLTYEQFCQNPSSILEAIILPGGVSNTIDTDAKVKVKDYKPQSISNQNERQISKLTNADIESISCVLENEKSLLEFFGYEIMH
jgi:hypothetical protein